MSSTSRKTKKRLVNVLNKNGSPARSTQLYKAESSVRSGKSRWVNSNTIQVMYHHEDEMAFKREAWIRDEYTCYLCGEKMHEDHPDLTIDHITPKRDGGSIFPENLGTCCRPCNAQKGWRSYQRYFIHLYLGLSFSIMWWNKAGGGFSSGRGGNQKEEKEKGTEI